MLGHCGDFGPPVTNPLIFHQDWPAALCGLFDPIRVGDLLIGGHAVVLRKGDHVPAVSTECLGHRPAAEAAVEEEPKRLLEFK